MARRQRDRAVFTARERRAAVRRRRNVALVLLLVVALLAFAFLRNSDEPAAQSSVPRVVVQVDGRRVAQIPTDRFWTGRSVDEPALRRLLAARVRATDLVRTSRVRIVRRTDVDGLVDRIVGLGPAGGTVQARRTVVSATIAAPVLQQFERNVCEAAALQVLAATAGRAFDQRRLQELLPVSGTPDPQDGPLGRVWGDPDRGYVGRPDGGGTAGGFGVYPGPVRQVAGRLGLPLDDLTGRSAATIYDRLRSGRAVMVWVGLSDGPYGEWTTPQGRTVRVNFGEHTVVLHGIRADGRLLVSNPLQGTREMWTPADFERQWELLGRRALAVR